MTPQMTFLELLVAPVAPPPGDTLPRLKQPRPPKPAVYRSAGTLADDLGLARESESGCGTRLCLWLAVETAMRAAGWTRDWTQPATPAWSAEITRRVAAVSRCEDCPGAAGCKSWTYRRAWRAAQAALPPATTAWPLKFTGIRRCFEQYQVPLQPYSDPSAVRLRDQLRAGETLTVKGLRLTPLNAWVFPAALAGGGDGQA